MARAEIRASPITVYSSRSKEPIGPTTAAPVRVPVALSIGEPPGMALGV